MTPSQLICTGLLTIIATVAPPAVASTPAAAASTSTATETRPVYAHRGGSSRFVEDTRARYTYAAAHGSLLWETDVRFSRTDYPVLLHDADLRRFRCPSITIASVSVTTARRCTAANGQSISTLHEFVAELRARGARAMIELKTVPTAAQWKVLQTRLSAHKSRIVIESFHPQALVAASKRGYATAFLTSTAVSTRGLPAGTDWYAPKWTTLTTAQVRAMHAIGVKVVVWTPACSKWPTVPAKVDALISNDLVQNCP